MSLITAVFDDENKILEATRRSSEKGFEIVDTFTPYPVHGMDEAMRLKPSFLPKVCFLLGLTGFLSMLAFQLWTFGYSWPLNVGGKSFFASPPLIPIAFEILVLFASLGTVFVFLLHSKLYPFKKVDIITPEITDDKFVLVINSDRDNDVKELLSSCGAIDIREVKK